MTKEEKLKVARKALAEIFEVEQQHLESEPRLYSKKIESIAERAIAAIDEEDEE